MASQDIDTYLAELRRRLPDDVAEFGALDDVVAAFVGQAPGRRVALALLATGPLLGACWGMALVVGQVWTWPIPTPVRVGFGLTLLAVVATLALAATSRHSYPRTRTAGWAAAVLVLLDVAMVAATLLAAPALVWPMALAIAASVARIGLTTRSLPRVLG